MFQRSVNNWSLISRGRHPCPRECIFESLSSLLPPFCSLSLSHKMKCESKMGHVIWILILPIAVWVHKSTSMCTCSRIPPPAILSRCLEQQVYSHFPRLGVPWNICHGLSVVKGGQCLQKKGSWWALYWNGKLHWLLFPIDFLSRLSKDHADLLKSVTLDCSSVLLLTHSLCMIRVVVPADWILWQHTDWIRRWLSYMHPEALLWEMSAGTADIPTDNHHVTQAKSVQLWNFHFIHFSFSTKPKQYHNLSCLMVSFTK